MHIRFSIALGTPVMDDEAARVVAKISGIQIQPDTARIVGFFVDVPGLFSSGRLFLSTADIVAWGTVVHVRSQDVIVPAEEIIRLQSLLADGRTIIGQPIVTKESHKYLGVCKDVQFDTRHLTVEWLFPCKYWFLAQTPIPVSEVIEVTLRAIVVKEPQRPKIEKVADPIQAVPTLQEVLPAAPTPS